MTLRWRFDGEDYILESSLPVIGRRGPRIGRAGVEDGILRRRTRPWREIAALTWDLGGGGTATLAMCIFGDPWVKELSSPATAWSNRWEEWRGLLEQVRPFVEEMGCRVENREEPATHWWHLDPDAGRSRHDSRAAGDQRRDNEDVQ